MKLLASELRLQRLSLLAWVVSVAALVLLVVAFYPQVRANTALDSLYGNMSPAMQALLGGSDLTSPVGYLNTQLFAFFLPAVVLAFGLSRGARALAGEEEARTLDLLLAQPVARWTAYLEKSGALTVSIAAVTVGAWLPLALLNGPAGLHLPAVRLAAVSLQMGLFCLALSLAAEAVAAASGRRVIGLAGAAGYAFVSYVIYGLSGTVTWLEHLRPLTLWRWYLLNDPLTSGVGWREVAVLVIGCLIAIGAGGFAFQRRDLHN
ncbi:MAG: ABC transporter permease subunit [Mycobacteriales bacterium]